MDIIKWEKAPNKSPLPLWPWLVEERVRVRGILVLTYD